MTQVCLGRDVFLRQTVSVRRKQKTLHKWEDICHDEQCYIACRIALKLHQQGWDNEKITRHISKKYKITHVRVKDSIIQKEDWYQCNCDKCEKIRAERNYRFISAKDKNELCKWDFIVVNCNRCGRTTTSDGWKEDFYLRHKNLAFIKHCIERGWDVRYPIAQEDGFVYALCYECVVKLEAA